MRVVPLWAAILVACDHTAEPSPPSAPSDPTATMVSGTRLSVDGWAHGDLFVPTGFYDTQLDAPCTVTDIEGAPTCAPQTKLLTGFSDASCSDLVVVDPNPSGLAPLKGGMLGVGGRPGPGGAAQAVFGVGEQLENGKVFLSEDACASGRATAEWPADTVRWSAEHIDPSELVQFTERTVHATDQLDVTVDAGTDGSQLVLGVSTGGQPCVSPELGACFTTPPSGVFVSNAFGGFWRYADDACTVPGAGPPPPMGGCDTPAGEVGATFDECGTLTEVHVSTGEVPSGPLYTLQADGTCVPTQADTCSNGLRPVDPAVSPPFEATEVEADGLVLAVTKAGAIPVFQRFTLAEQQPCSPHPSAAGKKLCAPDLYPRPIGYFSREDLVGTGHYTDSCGSMTPPAFYRFAGGAPCGVGMTLSGETVVQTALTFAPWSGEVWLEDVSGGTCDPVANDGTWFVGEEASLLTTLPELERAQR